MKPVVFLGPSLPEKEAQSILNAGFRPPLQAGDLDRLPDGADVGIIDGLLESSLRLSISEAKCALDRGIRLTGAGSTGVLLALELENHGMSGVGRIFDFLRERQEIAEEMVVVLQRESDSAAVTIPLINALLSAVDYWNLASDEIEGLIGKLREIPLAERQSDVCLNFLKVIFSEKPVGTQRFEIVDYKANDARLLLRSF